MAGANMADANPNPDITDEAAALKQRLETDPEAAVAQIKAGGSKAALHHLLNTDPQFRSQTSTYATLLGWTDGTGVWVLKGSEQVYRDLKRLGDDDPSLSYNDCLEKLGATYYEHWNEHPATREAMENQVGFREGPGTTVRVD